MHAPRQITLCRKWQGATDSVWLKAAAQKNVYLLGGHLPECRISGVLVSLSESHAPTVAPKRSHLLESADLVDLASVRFDASADQAATNSSSMVIKLIASASFSRVLAAARRAAITTTAMKETPAKHASAIVLSMLPAIFSRMLL
jgi:hypothetical protein